MNINTYPALKMSFIYKNDIRNFLEAKMACGLHPVKETAANYGHVSREIILQNFIWNNTCQRDVWARVVVNLKLRVAISIWLAVVYYNDWQVIDACAEIGRRLEYTSSMRTIPWNCWNSIW